MHFISYNSITFTSFTSSTFNIERKSSRFVTSTFCFRQDKPVILVRRHQYVAGLILVSFQLETGQYQLSYQLIQFLEFFKWFRIFLDLLLFRVRFKALNNVCKTKVDFPLPETPVTHVRLPNGILDLHYQGCYQYFFNF